MKSSRIIISALRGGSGKTILSIGVIGTWKRQGKIVIPFKKGPDYIDAGWLALTAGQPCYNLDSFLLDQTQILSSFIKHSRQLSGIVVIEGNRGLYDGIDIKGTTSTAELAKLLHTPVILCLDCTKVTRTMAAVVLGCMHFDPEVRIEGIVLNRVAGTRHEQILQKSIEYHCGIPVVGALPVIDSQIFPERHMGLVPSAEHDWAKGSIQIASDMAKRYLNMEQIENIANRAIPIELSTGMDLSGPMDDKPGRQPRIGIIRDSAFQFYYPENIEALISEGAEIIYLSPLSQEKLPDIDALYIGGGFPETHAKELARNISFKSDVKKLAEDGLPIYAECGGLIYLGEEIILDGIAYPMAGVLPVVFGLNKRPQGHGYTIVTVHGDNPFFEKGSEIRGHEFHYSWVRTFTETSECRLVFSMKRGVGIMNHRDGICYKNTLATYTHVHAMGTPAWARAMIGNALQFRKRHSSEELPQGFAA